MADNVYFHPMRTAAIHGSQIVFGLSCGRIDNFSWLDADGYFQGAAPSGSPAPGRAPLCSHGLEGKFESGVHCGTRASLLSFSSNDAARIDQYSGYGCLLLEALFCSL